MALKVTARKGAAEVPDPRNMTALYLRRSTDKQERSIPDQNRECLREMSDLHLGLYFTCVDDALSGTTTTGRDGFDRLIRAALSPSPPFRHIIVCDYSRLFRTDVDETCHYFHLLEKNGIQVHSATERLPEGRFGLLMRILSHWKSQEDCVETSRRTFRGLMSGALEGCCNGGPPPYGYDLEYRDGNGNAYMRVRFGPDGQGGYRREVRDMSGRTTRVLSKGERIPHSEGDPTYLCLGSEERVRLVVEIFEMYVKQSMGFKAIAQALNERGIAPVRRRGWNAGTIKAIIENSKYTGPQVWNQSAQGKFHRLADGHAVERPKSEFDKHAWNDEKDWVGKDAAHPAIIDKGLFDAAQSILEVRGKKHAADARPSGRGKTSPYLLTGLLTCARCGLNYHGQSASKGTVKKDGTRSVSHYYVCNSYTNGQRAMCPSSLFKRDPLEQGILDRVARLVNDLLGNGGRDRLREMIVEEVTPDVPSVEREIEEAKRALRDVEQRIDGLTETLALADASSRKVLVEKLGTLARTKDEMEAHLSRLEPVKPEEVDCDAIADEIMATVTRFEDLFEHGTIEERKEFIRLFIEKIELDPDKRVGKVYVKRLPVPTNGTKESFGRVAGARYQPATVSDVNPPTAQCRHILPGAIQSRG